MIIQSMLPGLADLDLGQRPDERLQAAVEANVRLSMRRLLESPEGRARMAEGKMKLVGAIYEVMTARVGLLN